MTLGTREALPIKMRLQRANRALAAKTNSRTKKFHFFGVARNAKAFLCMLRGDFMAKKMKEEKKKVEIAEPAEKEEKAENAEEDVFEDEEDGEEEEY